MPRVAVTCRAVTTARLVTTIPGPAVTVSPVAKLLPVRVTDTLVPTVPLAGAIDVSEGTAPVAYRQSSGGSQNVFVNFDPICLTHIGVRDPLPGGKLRLSSTSAGPSRNLCATT